MSPLLAGSLRDTGNRLEEEQGTCFFVFISATALYPKSSRVQPPAFLLAFLELASSFPQVPTWVGL